jgi:propanediol dehydratase small subunit
MRKIAILLTGLALATTAGVAYTSRQNPAAADRALASVRTAREHRIADPDGRKVVFHPGYISRIEVVSAQGRREEIYRQTHGYRGAKPIELALTFRDAALAVFDPQHQILKVTVQTKDAEIWTLDEEGQSCPPYCKSGFDSTTRSIQQLPPAASSATMQNASAADRALASVRNAQEHQRADRAGRDVVYHPGYISRIEVLNARGVHEQVYRQSKVFHGAKPAELALSFRDAALAVFDPQHQILKVTVQTKDGEVWSWDEEGQICPPVCPEGDSLNTGRTTPPR